MSTFARQQLLQATSHSCVTYSSWKAMFDSIQGLQGSASRAQFCFLADAAAELLNELLREHSYQIVENPDLASLLRDLRIYIERQQTYSLLKLVFDKEDRLSTIHDYYGRLTAIATELKPPAFKSRSSRWKPLFDDARKSDQQILNGCLAGLVINRPSMVHVFGWDETKAVPIIASLQRYIKDKRGNEQEISVINAVISYLSPSTLEDRVIHLEPWIITAFEVDIGPLIGDGSLGKVFRGRWHRKDVAIKILKTSHNIAPRSSYINREMEAWSRLQHPNVLPFLGGHALDNEPFIVFPFLKHRTSRDYIQQHPNCNRLRLLYETSLGLLYLHSENILHGNIKGLNILIDDDEKPRLCDYGLAKIKADINSRSPLDPASSPCLGSRNWMAPELLAGGNLTSRCDVYSFGMTMYEIFTDDIPFGHSSAGDLYNIVVKKHTRLARPEDNQAPQLSDATWGLARKCWDWYPPNRIQVPTLVRQLAVLLSSSSDDGINHQTLSPHAPSYVAHSTVKLPRISQPTGF